MKSLKHLLITVAAAAVFTACHKDKAPTPTTPTAVRAGIYVLNQGSFTSSNGSLTYYDYTSKTTIADIFSAANGRGLGATPNDIKIYGGKMYIVVNVSNTVEVVNPKTVKSIKQISFGNKEPRSVAFYQGNAFVTSYDGTVSVIDTASLAITKTITVGRNPEQLIVANNKLYVANSGGLDFGNPDKTVSVIDPGSLTVTKTITVIADPINLAADSYGHVYVESNGDYNTIMPGITIIDDNTDGVLSQKTVSLGYGSPLVVNGDYLYYFSADNKVAVYNTKTQAAAADNFITDGTTFTAAYGMNVDSTTGELFVTDALNYTSNGTLYAFDKNGKKEYTVTVGISPGAIAFVNK